MKIELSLKTVIGLYQIGIIAHTSEEHKGHHVAIMTVNIEGKGVFDCIDCGEIFTADIVEA